MKRIIRVLPAIIIFLTLNLSMSFTVLATCDCSMPGTNETSYTVKPLLWEDSPEDIDGNTGYKLGDLYLTDTTTRVGKVYAAHVATQVYIKVVLDTGYTLEPGSIKRKTDWDSDGCCDLHGTVTVVTGTGEVFIKINRNHQEDDYFHYVLKLVVDSGSYEARFPDDSSYKAKLVFGGDDSWN